MSVLDWCVPVQLYVAHLISHLRCLQWLTSQGPANADPIMKVPRTTRKPHLPTAVCLQLTEVTVITSRWRWLCQHTEPSKVTYLQSHAQCHAQCQWILDSSTKLSAGRGGHGREHLCEEATIEIDCQDVGHSRFWLVGSDWPAKQVDTIMWTAQHIAATDCLCHSCMFGACLVMNRDSCWLCTLSVGKLSRNMQVCSYIAAAWHRHNICSEYFCIHRVMDTCRLPGTDKCITSLFSSLHAVPIFESALGLFEE